MSSSPSPLPSALSNQNYVTVSSIAGGFITLPDNFFVHPADPGAKRTVPSLTFLVTHPNPPSTSQYQLNQDGKPFHLMFDLGLRKSPSAYPQVLQNHLASRKPFNLEPGVAAQLQAGGLPPSSIDLVILSHVHYDHHGDPEDFPQAQFRIGYGAADVLAHGLGGTASHQHFEPDTLPPDRTAEFSNPSDKNSKDWKPLGPFPAALDLFNDSSVYVIDTPGHLPGHVNLLCRTKDRWIMLCGDAFHDRRLLTGEKEIGTWENGDGHMLCIHVDKEKAAESIKRLREFDQVMGEECELIAAHEEVWWERNRERQFPGVI
ncbi:Putative metallo-beta-lactamase, ribonuclease Z/Hydroxyacylglutathione hydrolase [Septoria linicola]|uniref:Metallo-beta-lactamase, ribonuclease Z/Hydroxyacylglutathione hydrolase n=1 Tax=Septoria linicola TaxID=215465 RepID=A0A9Q9AS08_9PEZI|nr:Putative metallo-beta-lactamase, ribonuclease Z/Hydroxyacylglutathione hydrolase [Septoria linicola]